jgi:hypothetical protein
MAFIDNAGSIILDVVLTDEGRRRMAKGDGSFKITHFAVTGDPDYSLYNSSHPSGSAYYDLEILQTPVLEAMTNNTSSPGSRLVTISRNNLLYLPVTKLNRAAPSTDFHSSNTFIVAVDQDTENNVASSATGNVKGIQFGQTKEPSSFIRVEQGLDTTEIPATLTLDPELVETQYIVEIDNRLGKLVSVADGAMATPSYIDDDNIASYFLSAGANTNFVQTTWPKKTSENTTGGDLVVRGPRGTRLEFMIGSSIDLATSTFLFTQLGSTTTIESVSCLYIDTVIRVTGATTGASINIPVRFAKQA